MYSLLAFPVGNVFLEVHRYLAITYSATLMSGLRSCGHGLMQWHYSA